MKTNRKWVALSSRTGSEILNISKRVSHYPDVIITNNDINNINTDLRKIYENSENKLLIQAPKAPNTREYIKFIDRVGRTKRGPIVTLHGWLRILPKTICNLYEIYNGHPALSTKYPELKGLDPQKRAEGYPEIGAIIHKCIPELDSGKVIFQKSISNPGFTEEQIYNEIYKISGDLWVQFLKDYLL